MSTKDGMLHKKQKKNGTHSAYHYHADKRPNEYDYCFANEDNNMV